MKKVMLKDGQIEKRVIQETKKGKFVIVKNKRVYITERSIFNTYDCSEYVEIGIDIDQLHMKYIIQMAKNVGKISDRLKLTYTEAKE